MTYLSRTIMNDVSETECWLLLRRNQYGVGRLAFGEGAPQVLPVNFLMDNNDVIIQTGEGLIADAAERGLPVGFEVDSFTKASWGQRHQGWSVLVRGDIEMVTESAEKMFLRLGHLAPAPGGFKPNFVRIVGQQISGRRFG